MVKHSVWWEYCRHIDQLGHAWQAGTRDYLATGTSLACSWWGLLASYCSCSTLCWATRNSPKVREIHQTSLHFPNLPPNTMFWIFLGQHMSVRSGQKRDEDHGQHEHLTYSLDSAIARCGSLRMLSRTTAYFMRMMGRRNLSLIKKGEIDSCYNCRQGEINQSEFHDSWNFLIVWEQSQRLDKTRCQGVCPVTVEVPLQNYPAKIS